MNTNAVSGIQAYSRAKDILIERHREEFDVLLGDERVKIGLPRTKGPDKKAMLLKRLNAQEAKLTKLREELEKLA